MDSAAHRPYRFSIQGGPFGEPELLADHARTVESLGYDELFTSDHIGTPGSGGRSGGMFSVDPFAPLLIAAAATQRLRVGPLVLNTEFYNPALLARTAATVDRLTSGRLVLGLGTGYSAAEHDSIGSPIREPGARVTRFGELLSVVRTLLTNGAIDHHGTFESVHFDDVGVDPVQARVPFLIGAHGRRVVSLAGAEADIFQFTGLTHAADGTPQAGGFAVADLVERARWLDAAAGERAGDIERSALVQFAECGATATSYDDLSAKFELDAEVLVDSPFVLSGSVGHIVDKLGRLRDLLGITHYVVRDADGFAPVVAELA